MNIKTKNYNKIKKNITLLLVILLSLSLISCSHEVNISDENQENYSVLDKNAYYLSYEDVLEYLIEYDTLPVNYLTKKEAKELGWQSNKGNLWDIEEGLSIGGDKFFNREGVLPKKESRQYYECDVNYNGGYRGSDRIIYSNDGLIYYTTDHYKTFELVYGDE